jgi:hypothetical protein
MIAAPHTIKNIQTGLAGLFVAGVITGLTVDRLAGVYSF